MFGYIGVNRKELTEENIHAYQSYYCGLCRCLKSNCGIKGQMMLNYDMTFLIILLTGLYEVENEAISFTCRLHPMKKREAWVTAKVLNGVKARFVSGLPCQEGLTSKTGKGVISLWGKSRLTSREVMLGMGLFYSEGVFGAAERTDGMIRIISKPSTQISFRVVAASSLEAELNSARRFENYMGL